jgi:hypothetical protein
MHNRAPADPTLDEIGATCIARARGRIPLLQAAADRIEALNKLPPDVLDAILRRGCSSCCCRGLSAAMS